MKSKYEARAFCLHCEQKVIVKNPVACGSRVEGRCPACNNKVSTLRIKSCSDPKAFTSKFKTRAMHNKDAIRMRQVAASRIREERKRMKDRGEL